MVFYKKLLSVFLALAVLFFSFNSFWIDSFAGVNGDYTYEVISETDKTAEIVSYTGSGGEVDIPEELDGYRIISLGESVFGYDLNTTVEKLVIPASIESISPMTVLFLIACSEFEVDSNNASYSSEDGVLFNYDKTEIIRYPCGKNQMSYSVPASVVSIGYAAFSFCSLKSINIPDGVEVITDYAFAYSAEIEIIEIPDTVVYLGEDAFDSCTSLKGAILSASLTSIYDYVFYGCDKMTEIVIPDSISSIEPTAFIVTHLSTVYGVTGSYAETFAVDNGFDYIDIDYFNYNGDMNMDKICNETDFDELMQISVGNTEPTLLQRKLGDLNSDGVIDGFDLSKMDRLIIDN